MSGMACLDCPFLVLLSLRSRGAIPGCWCDKWFGRESRAFLSNHGTRHWIGFHSVSVVFSQHHCGRGGGLLVSQEKEGVQGPSQPLMTHGGCGGFLFTARRGQQFGVPTWSPLTPWKGSARPASSDEGGAPHLAFSDTIWGVCVCVSSVWVGTPCYNLAGRATPLSWSFLSVPFRVSWLPTSLALNLDYIRQTENPGNSPLFCSWSPEVPSWSAFSCACFRVLFCLF